MFPAPLLPLNGRFHGRGWPSSGGHPFPNVAVLYAREDSICYSALVRRLAS